MDCYINKSLCRKANTNICNDNCKAFILLEAIYTGSNIPKRYRVDKGLSPGEKDLEAFKKLQEFKDNIVDNVVKGNNLFIYSKGTGNGKTSWATKISNEYIRKKVFSKNIDNLIYYVNTPELLEDLRRGYTDGEYDNIIYKLQHSDIVIFDDIGAEKSTEWVRERLYTIINYRVTEGLSTIYTSNLDIGDISINLGNRIGSRIKEDTTFIELKGNDRRGL